MYLIFVKILIIDIAKTIYHFVNDTNHADRFSSSNYSYNQNHRYCQKWKSIFNLLITVYDDEVS
ncbi:hypothetical protein HYD68_02785 [Mycoplasmopsis bovis]|nr:hypothetical protein HYD68_02785 [Mycoplasmopsis bovis]